MASKDIVRLLGQTRALASHSQRSALVRSGDIEHRKCRCYDSNFYGAKNMDIDDILREADPGSESSPQGVQDLHALTRAWVAERSSPELLEWPSDGLIERVNARIREQIERVEAMTGDLDPTTNFSLIVMQTELERWKYLVRGFLRARIAKIDKHTLHYLSTPGLRARLSEAEATYATRHQALLHQHYLASFLASFPPGLRSLDDTAGGMSMVDAPDLDTAVFVRALRDCVVDGRGRDEDDHFRAERGEIVVTRWADVRALVESGDVELI